MQPIYVSKNLIAASSNGIGAISTAVPSVVTLNTSALDTGRRIVFYSTADASTMTFTVTGYGDQRTAAFSETVTGSTASGVAATTTSDFNQLTSVSVSSNANIPFLIGTSSFGGTQWHLTNWQISPLETCAYLHFSTSANGMQARYDVTLDDPTRTYPNPYFSVPIVFNSTSPVGTFTSTDAIGNICVDGNVMSPFAAWRLTITSSSSGAGTVYGAVLQAGIG
jgi:hypothetical protein